MIYRKQGSVARWENGRLICVTESGIAIEDGDYFECRPLWSAATASRRSASFEAIVQDIQKRRLAVAALHKLQFERLIITHGIADHECEGRTWREETDRIHASLVHGTLRALVDSTTRRLDDLLPIANALHRAEPKERELKHATLAPNVTAALLPHLAGRTPPNVRLLQTAGGVDGYGNPIVEAEDNWPNAYRPSYRVRPVRMPHNLRLECDNTDVDEDAPRAIALLAPVTDLTIRVLVVDRKHVYPATIAIARITAVGTERIWYPYAAGSFGAAMML